VFLSLPLHGEEGVCGAGKERRLQEDGGQPEQRAGGGDLEGAAQQAAEAAARGARQGAEAARAPRSLAAVGAPRAPRPRGRRHRHGGAPSVPAEAPARVDTSSCNKRYASAGIT